MQQNKYWTLSSVLFLLFISYEMVPFSAAGYPGQPVSLWNSKMEAEVLQNTAQNQKHCLPFHTPKKDASLCLESTSFQTGTPSPFQTPKVIPFHTPKNAADCYSECSGKHKIIKGVSIVAPPQKFVNNPFSEVKKIGAEWVSVIPYAFAKKGSPELHYNIQMQWWGERPEGVRQSIRSAHAEGLKVMLKPHVYIPGGWVGHLKFDKEEEWKEWEKGYAGYVLQMAGIAEEEKVELFCFSTEFKHSILYRLPFWHRLIEQIRRVYHGKLCFSANWDFYKEIPFWAKMDFIGVSAYFPLSQRQTPSKMELRQAWEEVKRKLKALSERYSKPVLFTEYGYLSVEYTAKGHWLLEEDIGAYKVDEKMQAVALEALYESFWEEPWWAGGFLWKWYPNSLNYTGFPADKDYTPQGKAAIEIIKKWYEYECD